MNFHVVSIFFGAHYVELFKNACFRSLNWPLNQSALAGHKWHVYTKPEHCETVKKLFEGKPYELVLHTIGESMRVAGVGTVPTKQCDDGIILLNCLRNEIGNCIQTGSKVLFAPPDTIFGDGTVSNLLTLGQAPGTCVAVAHPRVLPGILEEIEVLGATRGAVSNAQLVTLSLNHAHDSWKFAEVGHEKSNSYVGGISWRRLSNGLISVTHRLPTAYLCDFNQSDWSWWWGMVSFGAFDHTWPGEQLVRQERLRYAGSSDACFICEVTDWDKNVPPEVNTAVPKDDSYWGDRVHHSMNRQFNVMFRGE